MVLTTATPSAKWNCDRRPQLGYIQRSPLSYVWKLGSKFYGGKQKHDTALRIHAHKYCCLRRKWTSDIACSFNFTGSWIYTVLVTESVVQSKGSRQSAVATVGSLWGVPSRNLALTSGTRKGYFSFSTASVGNRKHKICRHCRKLNLVAKSETGHCTDSAVIAVLYVTSVSSFTRVQYLSQTQAFTDTQAGLMCLESDEARCELDRTVPRILLYCVLHLAGGRDLIE